jgi:2-polyprenyl-6-methoxyphenol hydroxylase-like FAD-dependent oxidoreductase
MAAPKAIVIGGGIGGLAAAVALRKVGMAVTVFERAPEICEVGAGLSLWSNAVTALRRWTRVTNHRTRVAGGTDAGRHRLRPSAPRDHH